MNKILKIFLVLVAIIFLLGLSLSGWILFLSYKSSDYYVQKITNKAVKANDSSICNQIWPPFMAPDPRGSCAVQVAIKNMDITQCEGFGRSCYSSFFENYKTSDKSICQKLSNGKQQEDCYFEQAITTKDIEICSYGAGSSCYTYFVSLYRDPTICDKYIFEQQAKDFCYETVANLTGDEKWCQKILDLEHRRICLLTYK